MSDETTTAHTPPLPHAAPAPAPEAGESRYRAWGAAMVADRDAAILRAEAAEAEVDRLGLSNAELSSQLTRLDADWERSCATMRAEYESEIAALRAELAALRTELDIIANATPSQWEPDMRDQFQPWAQNRARQAAALSATPAPAEAVTVFGRWIGPEEDRVTRLLIHAAMQECDDEYGARPSDELIDAAQQYRAWEYEQPEPDQPQEADHAAQ